MAAIKNDGSVAYGSRIVAIGSAPAINFVAENFQVTRPTKEIMRLNENGEPNGRVTIAEFVKGSATLLLPASNTAEPALGTEFTETLDTAIGIETFYIDEIERVESNTGEKKFQIKFTKKVS